MATPIKTQSREKKLLFIAFVVGLIFIFLAYYQLFHKPVQINSDLVRLEKVLPGHTADVWVAKFSPDGKLMASGSVDSTVRIYTKNGELIRILKQPQGVTSLAFSPDGQQLTTSAYDGKVRLWNIADGVLVKTFDAHEKTAWCVVFSPDGKTIASSSADATIKLWDVEQGSLKQTLQGHKLTVWAIKFSPDGRTLVSGSFDHSIKFWDTESGSLLRTINGHTEAVVDLAFSPDGQMLASCSDDKTTRLWKTKDGTLIRALETPEHQQAVAFSPDGRQLVTGGRDKPALGEFLQNIFGDSKFNNGVSMRLWDVTTGELLQTFSQNENDVNDVAFSPDGKNIASASSDKTVIIWSR